MLNLTGQQKVDLAIEVEFGANLPEILDVIRIGGTIATCSSTREPEPKLPFLKMMFMDLTIRLVIIYALPEEAKRDAVTDINRSLGNGSLQHRIAYTFALDEIAKAREISELGRCRGCVVLQLRDH